MMRTPGPTEDTWGVRAVSTISAIAARKVDFITNTVRRLRSAFRPVADRTLSSAELNDLQRDMVKVVGELDWRLFVTETELEQKKLNLDTRLEDLDRQRIWRALEKRLGKKLGLN